MNMVIVVLHKRTHHVVTVIEKPSCRDMTKEAVALAWAKSQGFSTIPTDVEVEEVSLKSFAEILFGVIPCDLGDEIKNGTQ